MKNPGIHTITLEDGRTLDLKAGDEYPVNYTYAKNKTPSNFGALKVLEIAPYPHNNKGLFVARVAVYCEPVPKGHTFWIEDDGTMHDRVSVGIQMPQVVFTDGKTITLGIFRLVPETEK